ncbi:MAG: hypothetical protein AAFU77_16515 [Myxococcota bacterium]
MLSLNISALRLLAGLGAVAAVLCGSIATASARCQTYKSEPFKVPVKVAEVGLDTLYGVFAVGRSQVSSESHERSYVIRVNIPTREENAGWETGETKTMTYTQEIGWQPNTIMGNDSELYDLVDPLPWAKSANHWEQWRRQHIFAYHVNMLVQKERTVCESSGCPRGCPPNRTVKEKLVPIGFSKDVLQEQLSNTLRTYESCNQLTAGAETTFEVGSRIEQTQSITVDSRPVTFETIATSVDEESTRLTFAALKNNSSNSKLYICSERGNADFNTHEGVMMLSDVNLSAAPRNPTNPLYTTVDAQDGSATVFADIEPGAKFITGHVKNFTVDSGYYYTLTGYCNKSLLEWPTTVFTLRVPGKYAGGTITADVENTTCNGLYFTADIDYAGDQKIDLVFDVEY